MTLPDIVASANMVLHQLQDLPGLPAEGLLLCSRCTPVLKELVRVALDKHK